MPNPGSNSGSNLQFAAWAVMEVVRGTKSQYGLPGGKSACTFVAIEAAVAVGRNPGAALDTGTIDAIVDAGGCLLALLPLSEPPPHLHRNRDAARVVPRVSLAQSRPPTSSTGLHGRTGVVWH
jgi:hypothetical protein